MRVLAASALAWAFLGGSTSAGAQGLGVEFFDGGALARAFSKQAASFAADLFVPLAGPARPVVKVYGDADFMWKLARELEKTAADMRDEYKRRYEECVEKDDSGNCTKYDLNIRLKVIWLRMDDLSEEAESLRKDWSWAAENLPVAERKEATRARHDSLLWIFDKLTREVRGEHGSNGPNYTQREWNGTLKLMGDIRRYYERE